MASRDSRSKRTGSSECHYCGSLDHWMRNCPALAAELKARKASRQEKASINLVDNFDISSSDDDFVESQTDVAVNLTELNIVDNTITSHNRDWYIDSGASKHATGLKNLLSELEKPWYRSKVITARGDTLKVAEKGKVEISTPAGGIQLENVLYIPGITKNLLSVGSIADGKNKPKVLFDSNHVWILNKDFPLPEDHQIVSVDRQAR